MRSRVHLLAFLAVAAVAQAQPRPYIGYVYPAGAQQGTTVRLKLGGQAMDDANALLVTGPGVTARVIEYNRVINPQEITLLNEQLRQLRRPKASGQPAMLASTTSSLPVGQPATSGTNDDTRRLIAKIEKRIEEHVNRPASVALANILYAEVTIESNAPPGQRELRVATTRGISNPMVFHVGQLPETVRKPMVTASYQVLGKEELALRKRPASEVEVRITVPCTVNGQIASGEKNRYRFTARKGQKLVISALARQLIPYIADAVPGWFQPVLVLYDSSGRELAYDDDFRFKPDPTLLFEVPAGGEYVLAIYDAIFRGREDFVYRITVGETPFLTSIFPLGSRIGSSPEIIPQGWNLDGAAIVLTNAGAQPRTEYVAATAKGFLSNRAPFTWDNLPECVENEANNTLLTAQKVQLPIAINGRIQVPNDLDVFQFHGRAGDAVVAEVYARRLDSPLDSVLKLTDNTGRVLAFNDDWEDLGSGVNTHHADSYLRAKLPADGDYFVHLGDTARNGAEEYGYRLRISAPEPDFALRVVPSSASLRSSSSAGVTIYAIRKDGFTNAIKLGLKDAPLGFSASAATLSGTQAVTSLTLRTTLRSTPEPVTLSIVGTARVNGREITHVATPAEDRMQAFLWRHLVPASELKVVVFDPSLEPPPKRGGRRRPPAPVVSTNTPASVTNTATKAIASSSNAAPARVNFTKNQVAGRLRQLKLLFEEGLLTPDFYADKVAECEAAR